ncbi:MAG TPA: RimK/LysX family protein [Xanthomonadaceae bacterium]|nr:RimK/LysX family protein [Xanthomonadaceae bacterium]
MSDVVVLGWREWVALPELGIGRLRAKVDTGARSSALHVDAHWRFVEGGAPWVGFRLHVGRRFPRPIEACAPLHDEREVVDSGGHRCRRPFLRTTLSLAGHARAIELNLCDRRGMLFPMLLGRSALDGLFAVDPARSFVHGRARRAPDAMPRHGNASMTIPPPPPAFVPAGGPSLRIPE